MADAFCVAFSGLKRRSNQPHPKGSCMQVIHCTSLSALTFPYLQLLHTVEINLIPENVILGKALNLLRFHSDRLLEETKNHIMNSSSTRFVTPTHVSNMQEQLLGPKRTNKLSFYHSLSHDKTIAMNKKIPSLDRIRTDQILYISPSQEYNLICNLGIF